MQSVKNNLYLGLWALQLLFIQNVDFVLTRVVKPFSNFPKRRLDVDVEEKSHHVRQQQIQQEIKNLKHFIYIMKITRKEGSKKYYLK